HPLDRPALHFPACSADLDLRCERLQTAFRNLDGHAARLRLDAGAPAPEPLAHRLRSARHPPRHMKLRRIERSEGPDHYDRWTLELSENPLESASFQPHRAECLPDSDDRTGRVRLRGKPGQSHGECLRSGQRSTPDVLDQVREHRIAVALRLHAQLRLPERDWELRLLYRALSRANG